VIGRTVCASEDGTKCILRHGMVSIGELDCFVVVGVVILESIFSYREMAV
jgi:hypothetical protein